MKDFWAKVKCPYCGFEQMARAHPQWFKQVVTCDLEEGGCDRDYVVRVAIQAVVTETYRMEEVKDARP